jgi:hypothetical protein
MISVMDASQGVETLALAIVSLSSILHPLSQREAI